MSEVRFPMHMFFSSFSFFLPDQFFCHCISSIISFIVGHASSFYFLLLMMALMLFQNKGLCFKKYFNYFSISYQLIFQKNYKFLKHFLCFSSFFHAIQTLIQIFNFLIIIRDFVFLLLFIAVSCASVFSVVLLVLRQSTILAD